MQDEVRLDTTRRRLLLFLVLVAAAQALVWSVWGVGDYRLFRVVLAVMFSGVAIGGTIVLARDSSKRHAD